MKSWRTVTGALLLGWSFLAGHVGNLSPAFRECVALALWAPVLFVAAGPMFFRACPVRKLAAAALILVMGFGFAAGSQFAMVGLLLSLLIFPVLEKGLESSDADFQALLLSVCLVGSWTLLQDLLPQTFLALDRLSAVCCGLSSFIVGQPIEFGPTYSGIWFLIVFLVCHVSTFVLSEPRRGQLLAGMIAGQLILLLLYQILFHVLLAKWQLDSAWVMMGVAQLGLFALGFGLILLHRRWANLKPVPWRLRPGPITALGSASFLLVLCASGTPARFFSHSVPPKVLLYDDGTLDWSVPVYGQYGGIRGGMFGSLGEFLQRHGCAASRGSLTNGALEEANVLVVFNLMHKFQPEEKRQIWDFVARGGALLAVGDHTGTTQIREPFNDLLEPVNVRFNFDCAMPIRRRFANGIKWFPHASTAVLETPADTQINVGASLSTGPPALPLVIGTHGFSDKGDLQNSQMGYLGDRRFSNDERLGDVVLVATANYKAGKVMVFGDTSTFQNGALARGEFAENIFRWLPSPELRASSLIERWLPPILFIMILWALFRGGLLNIAPAIYVGLLFGGLTLAMLGHVRQLPRAPAGEALLDCSHLNRCNPELWEADGLGGLVQNLMRKRYFPVVANEFSPDLLRRSRVAFLMAPAKEFSPRELNAYDEFVRGGGELFISVGYEDSAASQGLLQQFGLKVRNLPLGLLAPDSNDAQAYFLNAWPVVAEGGQADVVCRRGDYPLVVAQHRGQGRVIAIGDSAFFQNRNLEMAEAFNTNNIEFFRKLVPERDH